MELQKELDEQLAELRDEASELVEIIVSLSRYPHATTALIAALEACKDEYNHVLQKLITLEAKTAND